MKTCDAICDGDPAIGAITEDQAGVKALEILGGLLAQIDEQVANAEKMRDAQRFRHSDAAFVGDKVNKKAAMRTLDKLDGFLQAMAWFKNVALVPKDPNEVTVTATVPANGQAQAA